MNSIARVAVNVPGIHDLYDYEVPPHIEGLQAGCLIVVPFGNLKAQAVVMELLPSTDVKEVKKIIGILDSEPALNQAQLAIAARMARYYHTAISNCIHMMLPPGLNQLADVAYFLLSGEFDNITLSETQKLLLRKIQKSGELRARQIRAAFSHMNWKYALQGLMKKGIISSKAVLPDARVNRKTIRTAQIAVSPQEVSKKKEQLGKINSNAYKRKKAAVEFLVNEAIPVNVSWVYASSGANAGDLKFLEDKGFVHLGEEEIWRDPLKDIEVEPASVPDLTSAQKQAWSQIEKYLKNNVMQVPLILHGVTGSGKTELYLRAVENTLAQGRQVIVLVPEISLTPQTVKRFMARFPGRVGLVHSRLSAGERYDTWRRARMGKISVIIGPRSALFTTLPNLGLIVIDEFHDSSFYQNDFAPTYDAVYSAIAYAKLTNSGIILGSATPDISLYFKAQSEGWPIVHLPDRILAHQEYLQLKKQSFPTEVKKIENDGETAASLPLPFVQTVDMRNELRQGNRSLLSRALQSSLQSVLNHDQQAILFLNRRGSASYVFCRDCGNVLRCPRCDMPLTWHADRNRLVCHSCGYVRSSPEKCPACGKEQIRQYGSGTQTVEKEISSVFPQARVLRWDADTAHQRGAEELLLSHFANHHADILIGTQMLAKGLDLPLVTLVGIILADVGLNFPDYRATERTFQVLTQVAGRSGRSPLGGHVVMQTYQPQHYVIRRAAAHDFKGFYNDEITQRRKLGYPPFNELVRLEFRHPDEKVTYRKAQDLAYQIRQVTATMGVESRINISGPTPPFFPKIRGAYRQQILLRGKDLNLVLDHLKLDDWHVEINPPDIL